MGEATPPDTSDLVYLTIIVKPFRMETVLHALTPFRVSSVLVSQARGYGRQKGHLELYRGREYAISFIPKVRIELAAPRAELEDLVKAVERAARTGRIGDGKIFVLGTVASEDIDEGFAEPIA
jgi:nitrogen regulatory protein P-II 2